VRLSDDKINRLSHLITDELSEDDRVTFNVPYNDVRLSIRKSIGRAMQKEAEASRKAEALITSQKRVIEHGSAEWDALFWKYYEEEISRLRSIR
jgi:hypothetical protein